MKKAAISLLALGLVACGDTKTEVVTTEKAVIETTEKQEKVSSGEPYQPIPAEGEVTEASVEVEEVEATDTDSEEAVSKEGEAATMAYAFVPEKSTTKWTGSAIGESHYGQLPVVKAEMEMKEGKLVGGMIMLSVADMTVDDIKNGGQGLIDHLSVQSFFDTESYPEIAFVVTSFDGGKMTGDLVIKEITAPVTFPVTFTTDDEMAQLTGTATVDRTVFELAFESASDAALKDEMTLEFDIVFEAK